MLDEQQSSDRGGIRARRFTHWRSLRASNQKENEPVNGTANEKTTGSRTDANPARDRGASQVSGPSKSLGRAPTIAPFVLIAFVWLHQVGPLLIATIQNSKMAEGIVAGSLATRVQAPLSVIVFALAFLIIVSSAKSTIAHLPTMSVGLIPAGYLLVRSASAGQLSVTSLQFAAIFVAIVASNPDPRRVLALTGGLTAIAASLSLLLGILGHPNAFRSDSSGNLITADKALFGGSGLLQGLFASENNMATFLVIGLPSCFATLSTRMRLVSVTVCLVAIAWASSRSAWVAVAAMAVLAIFSPRLGSRFIRGVTVLALAVSALLPFLSLPVHSLSDRPYIWENVIRLMRESNTWAFGGGVEWFQSTSQDATTYISSAAAFQAHNQVLQLLATGGVALLVALIPLFRSTLRATRQLPGTDLQFLAGCWLVAVLVVGMLETPFGIADRALFWPVTLVPIAVLVATGARPMDSSDPALGSVPE